MKFFRMVCIIILWLLAVYVGSLVLLFLRLPILFQLIRRRYFPDETPAPNSWSVSPVQKPVQRLDENFSDDDKFYKSPRYDHPKNYFLVFLQIFQFVTQHDCWFFSKNAVLAVSLTSTTHILLFQHSAILHHLLRFILSSRFWFKKITASRDFPWLVPRKITAALHDQSGRISMFNCFFDLYLQRISALLGGAYILLYDFFLFHKFCFACKNCFLIYSFIYLQAITHNV